MWIKTENPDISWITSKRTDGGEWAEYSKSFTAEGNIASAVVRFENDCTCAVFVNGEFIASGTGRLPERISAHEITSKLHSGENKITMVLGTNYFQGLGFKYAKERGYWLDSAALELCIEYENGNKQVIATDSSWSGSADGKTVDVLETARVTDAEYSEFWANCAVWKENHKANIPQEVIDVAGKEYLDYCENGEPEFVGPARILETDFTEKDGVLYSDGVKNPYIIYDFGRLVVGFTELSYIAENNIECEYFYDFSENPDDFSPNSPFEFLITKLKTTESLSKDKNVCFSLRRRAFRFLKITFSENVCITGIRLKMCAFPETTTGYFRSNDEMLNKAWEVGKYTLHVNKQQEYESCPRNEMQFFSGDGAIDALIDLYAYGSDDLLKTSLALKHDERSTGVAYTPYFNRITIQWDYFAWRIICIYLHYKLSGDKEFVKHFFKEAETGLLWQLERLDKNGLMFQRQCVVSTFNYTVGQTEWSCSGHRLGEKVALNCLLYKSLTSMAEMARAIGKKEKARTWLSKAEEIKNAINERLWNSEKECYTDSLDSFIAQDGNTLAVMFGVADKEKSEKVLSVMKRELWTPYGSTILNEHVEHVRGGNTTVSPLFNTYEAQIRFACGHEDEAMDLMRRTWGTMLKKGAETFWEFSPASESERWDVPSHAWSSGIVYLLSGYVLGIRPLKAEYKEVIFNPKMCDLTFVKGVVPTPKGFIGVSCEKINKNGKTVNSFRLALPKSVKLSTSLPENSEIEVIKY